MKQYRALLSVAFTFLVLFSSSNIMVGVHFCSGQIQNIAFFSKAESCAMEKRMPPCHGHETQPCCEDEIIVHTSEGFNAPATDKVIMPVPALDVKLTHIFISDVIPVFPFLPNGCHNYDPPPRAADLTVSLRTFLI